MDTVMSSVNQPSKLQVQKQSKSYCILSSHARTHTQNKLPVICYIWGRGFSGYMRKTHTQTQLKAKTTHFHFSSCISAFLGNTDDLWVKDFRYICCNTNTDSTSIYYNGLSVWEDDR